MGSVGDAYDNAMCESFFATLECELLDRRRFATQVEARLAVFEFIEGWYNPHRRHSALDYESPMSYEISTVRRPPDPKAQPVHETGATPAAQASTPTRSCSFARTMARGSPRCLPSPGCYALMATREEALAELGHVFDMIAQEYQERGTPLPEDTTEIVNA